MGLVAGVLLQPETLLNDWWLVKDMQRCKPVTWCRFTLKATQFRHLWTRISQRIAFGDHLVWQNRRHLILLIIYIPPARRLSANTWIHTQPADPERRLHAGVGLAQAHLNNYVIHYLCCLVPSPSTVRYNWSRDSLLHCKKHRKGVSRYMSACMVGT